MDFDFDIVDKSGGWRKFSSRVVSNIGSTGKGWDREKKKKKKKNFPRRGKYGIVRGMLDVACGSALG